MTRDPFAGFAASLLSLNRYCYGRNNSVTLTDPSGLDPGGSNPDEGGFCFGGVAAGTIGLVTMGIIDTGVAVANVAAFGMPVAAHVALLPVDAAAIAGTFAM